MENQVDMMILEQLKLGTTEAYEQLFRKYYKQLTLEAFLLLEDEMEAEDQVQIVFIEMWHKKQFLNVQNSIRGYLRRSVRNRCLDAIEKRKLQDRRMQSVDYHMEYLFQSSAAERSDGEAELDSVLKRLPPQRLNALYLVYLQQKKYKEAAEEMGITVNSIKSHLKLALKDLRGFLFNSR